MITLDSIVKQSKTNAEAFLMVSVYIEKRKLKKEETSYLKACSALDYVARHAVHLDRDAFGAEACLLVAMQGPGRVPVIDLLRKAADRSAKRDR